MSNQMDRVEKSRIEKNRKKRKIQQHINLQVNIINNNINFSRPIICAVLSTFTTTCMPTVVIYVIFFHLGDFKKETILGLKKCFNTTEN